MSPETSRRITVLRFPLIVGVVYIHAVAFVLAPSGHPVDLASRIARSLVSDGVARTAVPIFYLIAGFLLFNGLDRKALDLATYREKLKSRARTLLVPYLFWNTFTLLAVVAACSLPGVRNYVDGANRALYDDMHRVPIPALFRAYGVAPTPVSYQFWFIRDLIVLVVASPLIYVIAKATKWLLPALLGAWWLLRPGFLAAFPLSIEALFFFSLGSVFALRGRTFFPTARIALYASALFVLMLVAETVPPTGLGDVFHRSTLACGVLSVLGLSGFVLDSKRLEAGLVALAPASFFVFATHEPLLTILRKLVVRRGSWDEGALVALYLLVPILVVMLCLGLYVGLSRVGPRMVRIITGGR